MNISREDYREYIALLIQKRKSLDNGLSIPSFMKLDLDRKIQQLRERI